MVFARVVINSAILFFWENGKIGLIINAQLIAKVKVYHLNCVSYANLRCVVYERFLTERQSLQNGKNLVS